MRVQDLLPVRAVTSAKLVNSPVFNRMGLQVARTYVARGMYHLRRTPRHPEVEEYVDRLRRDGMVTIENFLPSDVFDAVCEESRALMDDESMVQKRMHGPTHYDIAVLNRIPAERRSAIGKFYADPRLKGLLECAERRSFEMECAHRCIERVRQGEETTEGDPETELHSDIFFSTHKAWLYLTDVRPQDGPLVYVPGSHRLSRVQAREIYRHSCAPDTPSRRIRQEELDRLGLAETVLECPRNTLVVADVCGYHRRSVGEPGGERMALHCSIRRQPFLGFLDRILDRRILREAASA